MLLVRRRVCPTPALRAAEIEAVVVDHIRHIAANRDLQEEVFRQAQQQAKEKLSRLRLERTQLKQELSRLYGEGRQGLPDQNGATLLDFRQRIERALNRILELDKQIAALENEEISHEDVAAAFHDFEAVGDKLSPREQSQIVGLLISSVEFDPVESNIELEFHPMGIKQLGEQMGVVA